MQPGKPFVANRLFNELLQKIIPKTIPLVNVTDAAQEQEVIFLDAREIEEYKISHIKDAVHVGCKQFEITSLTHLAKNKKIIVYCSVGWRSAKIGERILKAGYKEVYNLYGGIFEWANQGCPLYCKNSRTLTIHVYSKAWSMWVTQNLKKIV